VLSDSGITIYGQKTRSATTSALDRVNVSRLVVYLRRQLDLIARQYIFEPNDEITRKEIKNQIEKELNSIKVNRGLYDYAVVCDTSNNTPDRVDRNELWVDVAIEPVKAVEFIYIPVRIKNTGDIQAGL
jgi:phage tail sheath protein FI